jgi:glucose-6-phosphate isomerase
MENIRIDISKGSVSSDVISGYEAEVTRHLNALYQGTGKGNDFLGWVELPTRITEAELADIEQTAATLRAKADYVVVVGIGGSYLGTRAVIDALNNSFDAYIAKRENPVILYAGQNIGEDYTYELLEFLKDKSFAIIVVSKSGTTTEPAIAFRLLRGLIESKYNAAEVKERIVAITDESKGALRTLATQQGYKTFIIPDNVGGRYSVFTPVGLLPVAVAGFSIRQLIDGACFMMGRTAPGVPFNENPAAIYAAARNELHKRGKAIEILVNYNPKLHFVTEWWKQLYGESEGKEHKGIFPAGVDFTTDLHSMGQWIQEGVRNIFETVVTVKNSNHKMEVPSEDGNLDGLNFLAGKRIDEVNKMAELGTLVAHVDGGVPNLLIEVPRLNEFYLGQLLYFFEIGCGISGYLLDVNPFDQPGVEAYKKNMFALLEKPGFEEETKAIKKRLTE